MPLDLSDSDRRLDMLQRMPIFGAVRGDALQFLLAQTRQREVARGDYFFRHGEKALVMYVLEAGRVSVRRHWGDHELLLRTLGAGECFGEMALLDLSARSASVRAESDCLAIELSPGDLLRLFEHDAEQFALIQMNIARELSRRLRVTDELLFRATMGERPAGTDSVFQSL
ncbi:MAG: Crp/Fnr family transcriptional regulator [Burkholderiaceae bacterium]|nr:Crp/Fnr family transcriptional regulator [Burkholderiaceae bacterium]